MNKINFISTILSIDIYINYLNLAQKYSIYFHVMN